MIASHKWDIVLLVLQIWCSYPARVLARSAFVPLAAGGALFLRSV